MKKSLSIFVLFLFAIGSYGQIKDSIIASETYSLTLEDCIDFALNNNYNYRVLDLTKSSKELDYKQSKQERLPSVSASLAHGITNKPKTDISDKTVWAGNYGVSADVVIYNGGKITKTIARNKLISDQSEHLSRQYVHELTINIVQVFLSLLRNDELLKYQQTLLKTSEEQMLQGREQFKVGAIIESDYLLLESQYATNKHNILNTEVTRNSNMLSLKNLLSIPSFEQINIIAPDTTLINELSLLPSFADIMNVALETSPDLQISKYDVSVAQKDIELARTRYYPNLSFGVGIGSGYGSNYDHNFGNQLSDAFNIQASLKLSIPIYSNGRNKTKVKQSKINLQQIELQQNQTKTNIMQQVDNEYQAIQLAYSRCQAADEQRRAYKASFDAYSEKFKAGAITTVDLLVQQNYYISTLNDYLQSKYAFILNRKVLDVYMDIPVKL